MLSDNEVQDAAKTNLALKCSFRKIPISILRYHLRENSLKKLILEIVCRY